MRQLKITKQITNRNENSVVIYLQEVSKYPLVSPEEEAELALKISNGDDMAMHKLVEANLRFVISVAKQYQNQGLSFVDLINEGNVGLVKAATKFDATRGFKFISYAVWWIRQAIMQAISEQTRIVRLPLNRLASINKVSKAIPHLEQKFEREPTSSELADYLEIDVEQVEKSNEIKHRHLSFDKPMSYNGESDFTLYDLVQSENDPAPDYSLLDESTKYDLLRAVNKLNRRENDILTLTYGLNNNKACSLNEIAEIMQLTNERIRQIRSKALQKLKKIMLGNTLFQSNM